MSGKNLRIVFMGTPEFAVTSLKALVENNYQVVGVITAPDRPSGRGLQLHESDVKKYAVSVGLPVLQPEKLKDPEFLSQLTALKADIQVVVAFRMLPEAVWMMPPMGTFNLHGSLLPNYRGAAPLNWAIINGDTESGVTTFLLKQEIDTGHILFQEKVTISPEESVGDLHDKLMDIGAQLVLTTIEAIANKQIQPIDQSTFTIDPIRLHAPKLFKGDGKLNWSDNAQTLVNRIRGLSPYPTAWTNIYLGETETGLKIFKAKAEVTPHEHQPGALLSDNKTFLKIACADGYVQLLNLQLAGKKQLEAADFLRGFPHSTSYIAR
jgi:methionyl-tRNA formyltransferase